VSGDGGVTAAEAARIEQLADAAWPAAEQVPLGPWKLRATHGVTRRANSVFTAGGDDLAADELEALVETAEDFYARRALPAVFQISAGTGAPGLDQFLERRGYGVNGASEVWTADVRRGRRERMEDGWELVIGDEPDDAWFNCAFDEPADRRRVHEQIVRRVARPRVFVSARVGGLAAGCGMGVSAGGYTGVFAMATREPFRRRGIAGQLLGEVLTWAAGRGDRRAYLQVMTENDGAKRLYARAGFARAYGYHYRARQGG
jgi:GNAT superfamily N-acetyltransferase